MNQFRQRFSVSKQFTRKLIVFAGALIIGIGLIAVILHFASSGLWRASHYIILGCLVSAIATTILCESSISRQKSKLITLFASLALLSCYGVCVGIAASILNFFFQIQEWVAYAFAIPLGVLLLFFVAKSSE